jgi:hypothetical protein
MPDREKDDEIYDAYDYHDGQFWLNGQPVEPPEPSPACATAWQAWQTENHPTSPISGSTCSADPVRPGHGWPSATATGPGS